MTRRTKRAAPLIITSLIAGFICFLIWAALQAKQHGPRITDPDYYSKGLRYNSTLVEKRAASVLGWTIKPTIAAGQLRIHLLDKERQAVSGAQAQLFLYQGKDKGHAPIGLKETEPGVYVAEMSTDKAGELRARVEFDSGGARLSRELLLNF